MNTLADSFPIVGIGASAGGFEAISKLLKHLPKDTGMVFIFVQHLDPIYKSKLTDLLSPISAMPVSEIKNNTEVRPNHVYVIPPNTFMEIIGGVLKLSPRGKAPGQEMGIDHFFRSLAADQKDNAIGIILSGNGTDGTLGMQEIKAWGGMTFAQDEQEAKYAGMPHSAIANGHADFILPVEEIARALARNGMYRMVHPKARYQTLPGQATHIFSPQDSDLYKIFEILKTSTGVDFTYYKHSTIKRRLERRMIAHKLQTIDAYASYLKNNPLEIKSLYNDMLISVTSFFRDPQLYQYLKEKLFPRIVASFAQAPLSGAQAKEAIRIWVPGCATGEEVYSLAICFLETLEKMKSYIPIQIFGTDINDDALGKARLGMYIENIKIDVSSSRLERYFTKVNGHYQINKAIREMCVFARHNVLTDSPFSRLDLISCRNLLIYLEPVLQRKVIPIFHYSLKDNGYLILGPSESVGEYTDMFLIENKKYKLYSKKFVITKARFSFHEAKLPESIRKNNKPSATEAVYEQDIRKEADRIILQKYAPAGVMINAKFEIIQFRGHTSPFLEPAPGKASLSILKMARPGLFPELNAALQQAKKEGIAVNKKNLRIEQNGKSFIVTLDVIPIPNEINRDPSFLVLFEQVTQYSEPAPQHLQAAKDSQISRLKQELSASREYLQSTVEELETNNEKLQVANEEILSSNEELQSVNEELETSKEELQSTNEELMTLNEELQNRNIEINQTNNDLNNLITSVNLPIVILDNNLCIRRYTPGAETVMSLISSDIGRPLKNIRPNILVEDLETLTIDVLHTGIVKELEVQDKKNHWYLMRILPYMIKSLIKGIVMIFIDIDALKKSQEANAEYAAIIASSDDAIISKTLDGIIMTWNRAAEKMFGYTPEEAIGKHTTLTVPEQLHNEEEMIINKLRKGIHIDHYETVRLAKSGRKIDVSLSISPIKNKHGKITGAANITRDISERVRNEENLKFLSDVSKILSSSLDYQTTLQHIAELSVPHIADWCGVDIKTDGGIQQLAVAHIDPKKVKWAKELNKKNPPDPNAPTGVPRVLRTGKAEFYPVITDQMLAEGARNEEELSILRKLKLFSAMIVPLIVNKETIGAITFITSDSGYNYTKADLTFALEIAKRAALAIENARLFQQEQSAVRLRNEFISVASHELKTPVTSLKMYTQVLERMCEKQGERDFHKYFEKIDYQISKLTVLINDLLNISKLQQGKLQLTKEPFDLNELVKDIVEEIQLTTDKHRIQITGRLNKNVFADRYRMYQVFTNLLTNAIKYSPKANKIIVRLTPAEKAAVVSVQDFGIGIDKDQQEKIFDQFYRVTSSDAITYPGLGMGLYISKEIINRHGGEISVKSVKGKGSQFIFTLPYS